ncbi:MAG: 4-hydroxythreonine-4-phosphate dehydrogenase PdxA [Spirochaetales bacterium]|nr:4-hydroxythreonine-4-phosphate dehydrogenase PdxA [Spirochaetales bacterium]
MALPIIGVPLGDPAGIGPEIIVKALKSAEVAASARVLVVGDRRVIEDAMNSTGVAFVIREVSTPAEALWEPDVLNLLNLANVDFSVFKKGEVSGMCGRAAYDYIERTVELAMSGRIDAVATTPINKEALKAGGVDFIGHTEIFASLTGTKDPLTMFEVRGMRVFFLSRHVSLRRACDLVKKDRIIEYAVRCFEALRMLGVTEGTMAVAGLNPHSGEHGLFGTEEVEEVEPAVKELQAMGYRIEGPIGADSVFHLALSGRYNCVLSLYHDQGHIATKTVDFDRTIAVTGGMPILRTSVDHGTAMDIAGKGIARETSMVEAIRLAARYSAQYSKK